MKVGIYMNFGEKLYSLRKGKNLSQESLAEILNVSRQAVSKWEGGQSYPEMEKLIVISDLFGLTLDELIKDTQPSSESQNMADNEFWRNRGNYYERKSEKMLFGLPLYHINIGMGKRNAKGIIAIGNTATGVVAIGLASFGVVSIGLVSLGIIGLGFVSLGLLLAIANFAVGTISIGAISVGVFSLGAVSCGMFSFGALASATHIAVGHTVSGRAAIGEFVKGASTIEVEDANQMFHTVSRDEVRNLINHEFPNMWRWITNIFVSMFK